MSVVEPSIPPRQPQPTGHRAGAPGRRGPNRREWWIIAVAIAVVVAITTVGVFFALRGGANEPDGSLRTMADRVASAGAPEAPLLAVDVSAARDALGLPADASPVGGAAETEEQRDAQAQLSSAFMGLTHLRSIADEVALEAIDLSAITAIAGTTGRLEQSLTLVKTGQDFEEIASAFESGGYERKGDLLSRTGGDEAVIDASYTHIAWSDGMLALTSDPEADASFVSEALNQAPSGDDRSAFLGAQLDQAPAAWVRPLPDEDAGECVAYAAVRESFTGTSSLVLGARDDVAGIEPTLTDAAFLGESFSIGEPQQENGGMRIDVEATDPQANLMMYFPEIPNPWTCR